MSASKIIYTHTDEAPALATESLLPIIRVFTAAGGIEVETRDISLAGRILANFPDYLTEEQRIPDALTQLGELALTPEANIIKLPNISASVPQLRAAVEELQAAGYAVPDYPGRARQTRSRRTSRPVTTRSRVQAVNPVLREGNSDRRAPKAVKQYAMNNPHSMGPWSSDSKTHVSTMSDGDFRSNEQSVTMTEAGELRIELVAADGTATGAEEVGTGPGRRGGRCHLHEQAETRGVPGRADRRGQTAGCAVLPPHEGHHDEGLGSDHLRPCGEGLLRRRVRRPRRHARADRCQPEQRPRQRDRGPRRAAGRRACRPSRPPSRPPWPTGRILRWSTPIAASPTFTCRAM